jgi:hypothetical protein
MGVPGPNTEGLENLEKCFWDETLRIELSGLEQRHLSVVDIPRLFHSKDDNFDIFAGMYTDNGRSHKVLDS